MSSESYDDIVVWLVCAFRADSVRTGPFYAVFRSFTSQPLADRWANSNADALMERGFEDPFLTWVPLDDLTVLSERDLDG